MQGNLSTYHFVRSQTFVLSFHHLHRSIDLVVGGVQSDCCVISGISYYILANDTCDSYVVVGMFVCLKTSCCMYVALSWRNCSFGKRKLIQSQALAVELLQLLRLWFKTIVHLPDFCDVDNFCNTCKIEKLPISYTLLLLAYRLTVCLKDLV